MAIAYPKFRFIVGFWHNQFTLIPIPVAVSKRKKIDIEGDLWWNVLETSGQPVSIKTLNRRVDRKIIKFLYL